MNNYGKSSEARDKKETANDNFKIDNVNDGSLEFLNNLNALSVQRELSLCEITTGWETENRYTIIDPESGTEIFTAKERSGCCDRNCLGQMRRADIAIANPNGVEVLHLTRLLRMQYCCCPCCLQKMEVCHPPGNSIGIVRQKWSICHPKYLVEDKDGNPLYKIKGPIFHCGNVDFEIFDARPNRENVNEKIGKIKKKWGGILKEVCTDYDNFMIEFPDHSSVTEKCLLLGASFLIDYMYFEC